MTLQRRTIDITKEEATAQFQLGELHISPTGQHYRYMQADGVTVAANFMSYRPNTWQIEELMDLTVTPADSEGAPICVPALAMTDNYYAWVFVGPGTFTGTAAEECVADAILYGHATAGGIGDTASALLLRGVTAPVTVTTGTGTFYASQPMYAEDLP